MGNLPTLLYPKRMSILVYPVYIQDNFVLRL
nr:MAG TPA: hypothetical protein [Caudoviricetes sp.]